MGGTSRPRPRSSTFAPSCRRPPSSLSRRTAIRTSLRLPPRCCLVRAHFPKSRDALPETACDPIKGRRERSGTKPRTSADPSADQSRFPAAKPFPREALRSTMGHLDFHRQRSAAMRTSDRQIDAAAPFCGDALGCQAGSLIAAPHAENRGVRSAWERLSAATTRVDSSASIVARGRAGGEHRPCQAVRGRTQLSNLRDRRAIHAGCQDDVPHVGSRDVDRCVAMVRGDLDGFTR